MSRLASIVVIADPDSWAAVGFDLVDDSIRLGNGAITVVRAEQDSPPDEATGISRIVLADAPERRGLVDGLAVGSDAAVLGQPHSNGALDLDHIVVMTDSLERTSSAFEAALDIECRRIRETTHVRQAFHRFDDSPSGARGCILEIVEDPRRTGAEWWGLVVTVGELDDVSATYPDLLAPPKPAVQPHRRIATVRRQAGLGTAVAFMSP